MNLNIWFIILFWFTKFWLSSNTFSFLFQLANALDHETSKLHSLELKVTDSGGNIGSQTLTVTVTDVNDNIPKCSEISMFISSDEGVVPSGAVYKPNCSDAVCKFSFFE